MWMKVLEKLDNNRLARILQNALMLASPFLIIGALAKIVCSFPVAAYTDFITSLWGGAIYDAFHLVYSYTFGSFSLILAITVAISFRNVMDHERYGIYPLTVMTAYMLLLYPQSKGLSVDMFQPLYALAAVVISLLICIGLYYVIRGSDRYDVNSSEIAGDTRFHSSFLMWLAVGLFLAFVAGIRIALDAIFGDSGTFLSLVKLFVGIVFPEGASASYGNALLYVFLSGVLWYIGIPADEVLADVRKSVFSMGVNGASAMDITGLDGYSDTFFRVFVELGGCGGAFCLVLAMAFASKEQHTRRQSGMLFVPTFFNFGQTALFTVPVFFSPILLVPFLCVPIVLFISSTFFTLIGFVPPVVSEVDTLMPLGLSGFFATESWRGVALQLFNLALGTAIYVPFVRLLGKPRHYLLQSRVKELTEMVKEGERVGVVPELLKGDKEVNRAAKRLLADMYDAIERDEVTLYYQPQVNSHDEIIGAEGLFRFNHPTCGFIYPPLAIHLAKEDGFVDQLTLRLIDRACEDLETLAAEGCENFKLSVNILPMQLEDANFAKKIKDRIDAHDFGTCSLALEVTEQDALVAMPFVESSMHDLKQIGVDLIMDDFGMGHSSMTTMQKNRFNYVKLDGNLVKDLLSNERSADIVQAVCRLADKLEFQIIAEYVETEEQKKRLSELGCEIYQGYLYSKALPFNEFLAFWRENVRKNRKNS